MIADALVSIYEKRYNPLTELDRGLFRETLRHINSAVSEGFTRAHFDPTSEFARQIRSNNEIWSAFKVHRMQQDIAGKMLDRDGNLKSFSKFAKDVRSITDHQCKQWLRTEYDTAVLRAHRAAEYRQFEAEKDVLPNIEWTPTTSHTPGEDHRLFWGVVRPVGDRFWQFHRPGDRWNCKCGWEQTDRTPTSVPTLPAPVAKKSTPHAGLDNNPAVDGRIFGDSHPYFPKNCAVCPLNKGLIKRKEKNCYTCSHAAELLGTADDFKKVKEFKNGGAYFEHEQVDRQSGDYKMIKRIGGEFARMGMVAKATPKLHFKGPEYKAVYGSLIGTKYERKCPDLLVDGKFYEVESFIPPFSKRKMGNMIKKGLLQSDRIIINNTRGCSDRYIKKLIVDRIKKGQNIKEVWIYNKGKIRLLH
ncbi:MAG: phage minor head protein [Porphyromonadaceae bacterium]|nr:phage minor head protein [Porphyromonadaceae bacterium]